MLASFLISPFTLHSKNSLSFSAVPTYFCRGQNARSQRTNFISEDGDTGRLYGLGAGSECSRRPAKIRIAAAASVCHKWCARAVMFYNNTCGNISRRFTRQVFRLGTPPANKKNAGSRERHAALWPIYYLFTFSPAACSAILTAGPIFGPGWQSHVNKDEIMPALKTLCSASIAFCYFAISHTKFFSGRSRAITFHQTTFDDIIGPL